MMVWDASCDRALRTMSRLCCSDPRADTCVQVARHLITRASTICSCETALPGVVRSQVLLRLLHHGILLEWHQTCVMCRSDVQQSLGISRCTGACPPTFSDSRLATFGRAAHSAQRVLCRCCPHGQRAYACSNLSCEELGGACMPREVPMPVECGAVPLAPCVCSAPAHGSQLKAGTAVQLRPRDFAGYTGTAARWARAVTQ